MFDLENCYIIEFTNGNKIQVMIVRQFMDKNGKKFIATIDMQGQSGVSLMELVKGIEKV